VVVLNRQANSVARTRRRTHAIRPATPDRPARRLAPRGNRRARYLIFGLVLLITGANVAAAIASAHDSSAVRLPRPAAVQPQRGHYRIRQNGRLP
jgi:hypothetical protein